MPPVPSKLAPLSCLAADTGAGGGGLHAWTLHYQNETKPLNIREGCRTSVAGEAPFKRLQLVHSREA